MLLTLMTGEDKGMKVKAEPGLSKLEKLYLNEKHSS